eukprot:CAMPEP_0117753414 /NCGR_PEP_ID=MMETSP0947-20121206/12204_1 /TAXON_ID=44440 /ORGANISM="Chattonella subsalsa, Strain CCMP2191" /LENGTH=336 /DNA_ID=CAMNT_0005572277 /DNA_START=120 /DNA_END=1130 /DNA_ORIENTATION=+
MKLSAVCISLILAGASAFTSPQVSKTLYRGGVSLKSTVAATSQKFYPDGKLYQEIDEEGTAVKTYIYGREGDVVQVLDKDGNPDTELFKRFGHLKGAKVKTVSETLSQFYSSYGKPIFPQYRNIVTEILTSTHLSVVCAMFTPDPIFTYGLKLLWQEFMGTYPVPEHCDQMYESMIKALGFDVEAVAEDEKKVLAFVEGKSEDEILAVIKGEADDAVFGPVFKAIREDKFWWYSRPFGAGIFSIMKKAGVELNNENLEKWVACMNVRDNLPKQDLEIYQTSLIKIKEAEKMYKEVEIREKKAMAKRLEEKAQRALEKAEAAAKRAAEPVAETDSQS